MKKIVSLTAIIFFFLLVLSPLAFKQKDKGKTDDAVRKTDSLANKKVGFVKNVN